IGQLIASSASLSLINAERQLAGVTPDKFARLARPGGVVVKTNHPAWVFGHLAVYPARIMEQLGLPHGETGYPPTYEALFKNGTECCDDPDGSIYPPMQDVTKLFFSGYKAAMAAVSAAPDEKLLAVNPNEGRMRELFPTLGGMLIFYLTGHTQNHLGQIS